MLRPKLRRLEFTSPPIATRLNASYIGIALFKVNVYHI